MCPSGASSCPAGVTPRPWGAKQDVHGSEEHLSGTGQFREIYTAPLTTGTDGSFGFRALPSGAAWGYSLSVSYKGVEFSTDRIVLAAGETKSVTIPIYPTTTSSAAVSISTWTVWLDQPAGSRMAVQQDLELVNSASTSYIGDAAVSGAPNGGRAVVQLPLVTGAQGLEYVGRFEVCCGITQPGTWIHTRPLDPGRSQGTLRYEAPLMSTLSIPITMPTQTFTLLAPSSLAVTAPELSPAGTSSDRGISYTIYQATSLTPGMVLRIAITPRAGNALTSPLALGLYARGGARCRRRPGAPATQTAGGLGSPPGRDGDQDAGGQGPGCEGPGCEVPGCQGSCGQGIHGEGEPEGDHRLRHHGRTGANPQARRGRCHRRGGPVRTACPPQRSRPFRRGSPIRDQRQRQRLG